MRRLRARGTTTEGVTYNLYGSMDHAPRQMTLTNNCGPNHPAHCQRLADGRTGLVLRYMKAGHEPQDVEGVYRIDVVVAVDIA